MSHGELYGSLLPAMRESADPAPDHLRLCVPGTACQCEPSHCGLRWDSTRFRDRKKRHFIADLSCFILFVLFFHEFVSSLCLSSIRSVRVCMCLDHVYTEWRRVWTEGDGVISVSILLLFLDSTFSLFFSIFSLILLR